MRLQRLYNGIRRNVRYQKMAYTEPQNRKEKRPKYPTGGGQALFLRRKGYGMICGRNGYGYEGLFRGKSPVVRGRGQMLHDVTCTPEGPFLYNDVHL